MDTTFTAWATQEIENDEFALWPVEVVSIFEEDGELWAKVRDEMSTETIPAGDIVLAIDGTTDDEIIAARVTSAV